MSTAIDERTDLEIIESLDFEHVPACEHTSHPTGQHGHSGPAWALIETSGPCTCPHPQHFYICETGWKWAKRIFCRTCGAFGPRDEVWHIKTLVNG